MGRVKLKIKRLESTSNRQVTYSKRRNGILKKSKELSILCDIDLILLMFSPSGKPTLLLGEHSNIDDVIAKFAQLTPQERNKRKLESLEALKRAFKKLDHDLNIQDFLGPSTQSVEELSNQVRILQAQITQVHRGLSFWSNPDKIGNIEHLKYMEDSLRESLNRIEVQKESFAKTPFISLECNSQFQNGMHLPLMMDTIQESPTLSWLPNNENQHTILSGELNFLPQRDVECSGYSLQKCSGLFGHGKTHIENTSQVDNAGKEGGVLNDLDTAACLRLQLNEQCPYQPYSSLDLPEVNNLMPDTDMNLHGQPLDFQLNSSFQLPRPLYDNVQHSWFPTSGPYHFNVQ